MTNTQTLKDGTTLTIRPLIPADAEQVVNYMHLVAAESDNLTFGAGEFSMTTEDEANFIQAAANAPRSYFAGGFIGNTLVSVANLRGETKARLQHNCEIGISVLQEFWNNGIASAMLIELIRFATEIDMRAIHLLVNAENKPAIRVYEKYGFEHVGHHNGYMNINGRYLDCYLMDLYL